MTIDARAFGPSQETQDARKAIGAAGLAAKAGGLGGWQVPYADTALGLASLFTDPTPQGAAKFVGQTATSPATAQTAASLMGQTVAANPSYAADLASVGLEGAGGLASGLASAGSGLAFSMFGGGGPFKLVLPDTEPSERLQKRAGRTRDAMGLTGETMRGLHARDLAAPVGNSTTGDTLAAMLNFNGNGTWFADTAHDWLPDPALGGLRSLLSDRGFTGREPSRGDVGGVGEMVMGGGLSMPNPRLNREALLRLGYDPEKSPGAVQALRQEDDYADLHGPQAWDLLLRQAAGVPASAPSVFDPELRRGLSMPQLAPGVAPRPFDWAVYGDTSGQDPETHARLERDAGAQNMAIDYLGAIDPTARERVLDKVLRNDDAEEVRRWVAGGGGTG